ncbi:MAG: uridine kinase [Kineosporiaceae bacterium]
MTRVVLLAGASGSGKTSLCRRLGVPVLALDDFYRDHDDHDEPPMPHRFGIVDWDDPGSWNAAAAVSAIEALCHTGVADVPVYDIPTSRRSGTARLDLAGAELFVAEGIFAAELVQAVRERGLLADALCLQLHPAVTFARRLLRDLAESRKPPITLLRRGFGLARGEAALTRHWIDLGCRPVSIARAEQVLHSLGA